MQEETRHFTTQLAVIGSGIAGFAAAIFAVNRKITTAQIGNTGAVAYTTGYLDLLGKEDKAQTAVTDPWQALEALRNSQPNHPLSRVPVADIHRGFDEFTAFLGECGLAYSQPKESNHHRPDPGWHPEADALRPGHHGRRTTGLCRRETLRHRRFYRIKRLQRPPGGCQSARPLAGPWH